MNMEKISSAPALATIESYISHLLVFERFLRHKTESLYYNPSIRDAVSITQQDDLGTAQALVCHAIDHMAEELERFHTAVMASDLEEYVKATEDSE